MQSKHLDSIKQAVRRYRTVAAFAVGVILICSLVVFYLVRHYQAVEQTTDQVRVETEISTSEALLEAEPTQIRIPKIGLDAAFEEPLGVNADRTIEVPDEYETVGWYKYGPTPGELGPAVVLGHVDSYEGPAVFYSLGQLDPGDEIMIDRADGTTATFIVETLERHEQSGFPTRKVYSDLDYPGLRLITCSGTYDHDTLRYSHNLIVFAKAK